MRVGLTAIGWLFANRVHRGEAQHAYSSMLTAALIIGADSGAALVSTGARADEDIARARSLYNSGIAHYNLTEYKEALADFKQAYRIRQDPALL